MGFDWISIVLVVIFLISVGIGVLRGFMATVISLVASLAIFFVAILLCSPLGDAMYGWGWGSGIEAGFVEMLNPHDGMDTILDGTNNFDLYVQVYQGIGVPALIVNPVASFTAKILGDITGVTLSVAISSFLTKLIFRAIAFVAIFLVMLILVIVLKAIFKQLKKIKFIAVVDRLGGLVAGAILGAAWVLLIAFLLDIMLPIPTVGDFIGNTIHLADDTYWSLSKWLVQNNFLRTWFLA